VIEAERGSIFADNAIDRVRIDALAFPRTFAVMLKRPKRQPVAAGRVTGDSELGMGAH
jgi:hypothetical protein